MKHVFEIEGDPVGKGRPRFTKSGHTYTDAKTREYEKLVSQLYVYSRGPYFGERPISMYITAHFRLPKGLSKKKHAEMVGTPCSKRPDADNLIKCIADALNEVAYHDDSQIAEAHISKMWSDTSYVVVEIGEIED